LSHVGCTALSPSHIAPLPSVHPSSTLGVSGPASGLPGSPSATRGAGSTETTYPMRRVP